MAANSHAKGGNGQKTHKDFLQHSCVNCHRRHKHEKFHNRQKALRGRVETTIFRTIGINCKFVGGAPWCAWLPPNQNVQFSLSLCLVKQAKNSFLCVVCTHIEHHKISSMRRKGWGNFRRLKALIFRGCRGFGLLLLFPNPGLRNCNHHFAKLHGSKTFSITEN